MWWMTRSSKVGFRDIKIKGNQILVNDTPIKLIGVNRHDIARQEEDCHPRGDARRRSAYETL